MPAHDGAWLLVVEALLKDTVGLGRAGYLVYATARGARPPATNRCPS
jgi:hypothetical protein